MVKNAAFLSFAKRPGTCVLINSTVDCCDGKSTQCAWHHGSLPAAVLAMRSAVLLLLLLRQQRLQCPALRLFQVLRMKLAVGTSADSLN